MSALPPTVGGYQIDQFVKKQDLELHQCGICLLVCKQSASLPCKHVFCRECVGRWVITNHTTCPNCRAEFRGHVDIHDVVPDPVQALTVVCEHADCKWSGLLSHRYSHIRTECEKEERKVACSLCKFYGSAEDLPLHKCVDLSGTCIICCNLFDKLCITCEAGCHPDAHKDIPCGHTKKVCGHTYHDHCLERWMRTHPYCPMCNHVF